MQYISDHPASASPFFLLSKYLGGRLGLEKGTRSRTELLPQHESICMEQAKMQRLRGDVWSPRPGKMGTGVAPMGRASFRRWDVLGWLAMAAPGDELLKAPGCPLYTAELGLTNAAQGCGEAGAGIPETLVFPRLVEWLVAHTVHADLFYRQRSAAGGWGTQCLCLGSPLSCPYWCCRPGTWTVTCSCSGVTPLQSLPRILKL